VEGHKADRWGNPGGAAGCGRGWGSSGRNRCSGGFPSERTVLAGGIRSPLTELAIFS